MRSLACSLVTVATMTLGHLAPLPVPPAVTVEAADTVRLDSYAEWRTADGVVVDGQRVYTNARTKWKGEAKRLDDIPMGAEVRVKGKRQPDGRILAADMDVRPNTDDALFESDVLAGTNELEQAWRDEQAAFEPGEDEDEVDVIGDVLEEGLLVNRVRGLVDRLTPPYVDRSALRVYVIDNDDWNAMAMGNGAIWVFSGIMQDMTDEELAIVVGHELAHYTHEHSRRQARRGIWTQLGSLAAMLTAEAVDNETLKNSIAIGAGLALSAIDAGYGRDLEDQADRVGLRYAYEAGFDVQRAPQVWQRFLEKYGEESRLVNFFFSDHSRAGARKRNLERELQWNYPRPPGPRH
ncbi:MAG: hypothetical protein FJW29_04545 [Acidobacteria bacterium]|nr:hypothetical protein [Acidobacteriota bacterium]